MSQVSIGRGGEYLESVGREKYFNKTKQKIFNYLRIWDPFYTKVPIENQCLGYVQ